MRFVDASVFVHSFIKPKRALKEHESRIKEHAKKIVRRIAEGEEVLITVVQIAELANVVEGHATLNDALRVEEFLLASDNVRVLGVTGEDCVIALGIAKDKRAGLSDAVAFNAMLRHKVGEIYSFDKDLDNLEIKRLTE
ncbi:MAG: type II toxin-antitoxin system VapC family toxin [Candidatus Verstraetearchaeota archaeon]|nr:type II toxin-antitoxin system VapC family toxin [Candidatus Verstraetearchaeota archaeon]